VHEHHSGCFGTCSGFEGELLGRINENERSGFRTFAALYKASLVRGDVAPYPIVREGFASLRDAEPAGPSPVSGVCPRQECGDHSTLLAERVSQWVEEGRATFHCRDPRSPLILFRGLSNRRR
jgi:hypothetical protein